MEGEIWKAYNGELEENAIRGSLDEISSTQGVQFDMFFGWDKHVRISM